VLHVTIKKS